MWSCYDLHEFYKCASEVQKHQISKCWNHFTILVQCHEFVQVMKHSILCPLPAGSAIVRDLRLWHGGTPSGSSSTRLLEAFPHAVDQLLSKDSKDLCTALRSLSCLSSAEWHSTLPNPLRLADLAVNCIARFSVFHLDVFRRIARIPAKC